MHQSLPRATLSAAGSHASVAGSLTGHHDAAAVNVEAKETGCPFQTTQQQLSERSNYIVSQNLIVAPVVVEQAYPVWTAACGMRRRLNSEKSTGLDKYLVPEPAAKEKNRQFTAQGQRVKDRIFRVVK
ncbi:hypothetical protein PVAR5_2696 [Paecilomyces variotii No. 5]|uniref:Uncharacterized protein n=1 Tax=Byssochlamys spectabilis (strain No. 5 / NBRC 109023) TaxID=1356009 RepID=V5HWB4_BYSSN|nr:hypothetical protein PVAR5_2696 [Paecilomyces variotii No. 5]